VRADGRESDGGGRAHQEATHRHDRYDRGTRPCAAATRALERAGSDRCPAWEHDKQQPADHLPKRPCPGTLPEIHRHARPRGGRGNGCGSGRGIGGVRGKPGCRGAGSRGDAAQGYQGCDDAASCGRRSGCGGRGAAEAGPLYDRSVAARCVDDDRRYQRGRAQPRRRDSWVRVLRQAVKGAASPRRDD
ncbi:hypothetical protein T492DRAFT_912694, partial [Pavlovales sp. CCMP2436]